MSEALKEEINFYKEQLSSFKDMMQRTVQYLEETQAELKKTNKELAQSISYAQKIQQNLLPENQIFEHNFSEHSIFVKQRNEIGGDMVIGKEFEKSICFGLMDCTGHGIPGALISMIGHTFFNDSANESNQMNPAQILEKINVKFRSFFHQENSSQFLYDSMDGILCSFNKETKELIYSTAGRPLWIKQKEWKVIKSGRITIGGIQKDSFKNCSIQLEKMDELFLFSDGIQDQFGGIKDKKFMSKRIYEILSDSKLGTLVNRTEKLKEELFKWQGKNEQTDDISLLAIKL